MSETSNFEWDVMIDMETLGTAPNSPVIAIGAWPFRLDGGPVPHEPFYKNVYVTDSAKAMGGPITSFYWWLEQAPAAKAHLLEPEPELLQDVIWAFDDWLQDIDRERRIRMWGHGASFDVALLNSMWFASFGDEPPWRYNAARDTRTLFHAAGIDWDAESKGIESTPHYALDDARVQATLVKKAWAVLHS